jgi:hypothetical protein
MLVMHFKRWSEFSPLWRPRLFVRRIAGTENHRRIEARVKLSAMPAVVCAGAFVFVLFYFFDNDSLLFPIFCSESLGLPPLQKIAFIEAPEFRLVNSGCSTP